MRILSLAPSNTEILYALGVGDAVVGTTAYCDWPAAARMQPKVGGWTAVYPDLLDRFSPDLIVTSLFVPPEIRPLMAERPKLFCHVEPHTLEGVYASIAMIGERIGRRMQATELIGRMRTELDALRIEHLHRPRIRVYIEEWASPPMASGNWIPEVAATVGIDQVVVRAGEWSRAFALTDLETADPHAIVLSICGSGDRVPTQQVVSRLGWGTLRAVREGRIAVIDDSLLNRPGPRLPAGARALSAAVAQVLERV